MRTLIQITMVWAMILTGGWGATTDTAKVDEDVDWRELPRWRGFNLQEKFNRTRAEAEPFRESDFQWISEWGFNFVRLPLDYRVWIIDGDWGKFDEAQLREIDQAIEWGERYGVHVCLNFHRAPGWTVADPKINFLWTDEEAQRVCALHWGLFAKRYAGIPNARLSFNLFNEPNSIDSRAYERVVRRMVEAIREHDSNRLIIADGLEWGTRPVERLRQLRVAQATRGYKPGELTHYRASWVTGSDRYPEPRWPSPNAPGYLYHGSKFEFPTAMNLTLESREPTVVGVKVDWVSTTSLLRIAGDGETLREDWLVAGPNAGRESRYLEQWDIWQSRHDSVLEVEVPANVTTVSIETISGDWIALSELRIERGDRRHRITLSPTWGAPPGDFRLTAAGELKADVMKDREWLWRTHFQRWDQFRRSGVGVMVGEWGVFQTVPHDVAMRWMEDNLQLFQRAEMGWALWNFRGRFGPLDNERSGYTPEDFRGHKLDRAMLELLQRY